MPVLAEASLSPRSAQKSVSTRFRQPKECPYRSQIPFSSAFHIAKHILRTSPSSIPSHRDYVLRHLSTTVTFQNT
jgi:hypothetical protein